MKPFASSRLSRISPIISNTLLFDLVLFLQATAITPVKSQTFILLLFFQINDAIRGAKEQLFLDI